MKFAVVDLGSNTMRLSLYEVDSASKDFELLFSEKKMVGIINYVEDGLLSDSGIEEACKTLNKFKSLTWQFGTSHIYVLATASLRNIKNTQEAVAAIGRGTGLYVDVVSGQDEAELGYRGSLMSLDMENGFMFDIGGGSTEVVKIRSKEIRSAQSLDMGCLNIFNRFVSDILPSQSEIKKIREYADERFRECDFSSVKDRTVCGVGGTARAVLKLCNKYFKKDDDNRIITIDEFKELSELLLCCKKEGKKLILKTCPDRTHTILPGIVIMSSLTDKICKDKIYISRYGVREGYLCRKLTNSMR